MSFDSLTNSSEFAAFLLENNAAFPREFKLRNGKGRLINTNSSNNSANIELTYYDEIKANNGVEFIRLYWFNDACEPRYFRGSNSFKKLSPQEIKRNEAEKRKREAIAQAKQYEDCKRAQAEYANAAVQCHSHQYLTTKGVLAHYGVKIATQTLYDLENGEKAYRLCKGELIIPIISLDKRFMGYQRIQENGKKLQCRDGLKRLGFFPMGGWNPKKATRIVLCEGYATGATIHEATGANVFVCFDVGNIQALAAELSANYKHIEIILATDFDLNKNQAGLLAGLQLSQQFNLKLVFPFTLVDGSDWNDLQAQSGLDFVAEFFNSQLEEYNTKSLEAVTSYFHQFLNEINYQKIVA